MPILIRSSSGLSTVEPTPYRDESELEAAIAASPMLVQSPGDAPLALVRAQVSLPDTGRLDIVLVDSDGLPVVVEVKLARNGESRRDVVAQVVDYVATLTQLTVDELDALVDGSLEIALRSFDGETDEDDSAFEKRWQAAGVNLRAGLARIVVALDEAPDYLVRIIRFLAQHSNLDVRLVTVAKYYSATVAPSMFLSPLLRMPTLSLKRSEARRGNRAQSYPRSLRPTTATPCRNCEPTGTPLATDKSVHQIGHPEEGCTTSSSRLETRFASSCTSRTRSPHDWRRPSGHSQDRCSDRSIHSSSGIGPGTRTAGG